MASCEICGIEVSGEGRLCDACLEDTLSNTTSFVPVGTPETIATEESPVSDSIALVVIKGPQMGEHFYLEGDEITIGRDPKAQLFLNDTTVSREHALVVRIGNTVILRDAGSLNGTYLNGTSIDEAELQDKDTVQIGTFHLMFRQGA